MIHSVVGRAIFAAAAAHQEQEYKPGMPFTEHLTQVVGILVDAGYTAHTHPEILAAGWLHDIIEDTPVTLEALTYEFGDHVANLVWACTGEGNNRKQKQAAILEKIKRYPDAAPVKCADRIANVEFGRKDLTNSKHKMYVAEHEAFGAVIKPLVSPYLWERLNTAITQPLES